MSEALVLCRASIAKNSKSFTLASRLLPGSLKDEAAVVYAFCRRADDAVDLAPKREQAAAVSRLRRELDSIYAGETQSDAVLAAFQDVAALRGLPADYAHELLAGMEMDAAGAAYADYDDLLLYCFRVAGTVGLMMSHVFGVRDASALRHAAHLGMGMQLTNVCRDVLEDWGLGRMYLPDALLRDAGSAGLAGDLGGPFPDVARTGVSRVIRELLHRAEGFYASGDAGLPMLSLRTAIGVGTARLVYSDIGRVILAQGADPLAPRAVVGKGRKLALALVAAGRALRVNSRRFEPARLGRVLSFRDVVPV
jgi:phytoene synthase